MPRYTIAYAKNIMHRTVQALIDNEPTRTEIARLWEYFKSECAYCGRKLTKKSKDAHIDHLVSAASRGGNELSNRVLSCGPCNGNEKRDMPWEDFLRRKNPDEQSFEVRRRAILQWQKQVDGEKKSKSSSKEFLRDLAVAEETVQAFERACIRLRQTAQKVKVEICQAPKGVPSSLRFDGSRKWQPRTGTIGFLVREMLLSNQTYAAIHEAVRREFPDSKFNKQHYAWYKNRLHKLGNGPDPSK